MHFEDKGRYHYNKVNFFSKISTIGASQLTRKLHIVLMINWTVL